MVVRAWNPKAVFWAPVVVLSSALVPPAVFPTASLGVGFGGAPQLGFTPRTTTRLRTTPASHVIRCMRFSSQDGVSSEQSGMPRIIGTTPAIPAAPLKSVYDPIRGPF